MTKLILSTGNIVSGGPLILRRPGTYRSNHELTSSLRNRFQLAQEAVVDEFTEDAVAAAAATAARAAANKPPTPSASVPPSGTASPVLDGGAHAQENGQTKTPGGSGMGVPSLYHDGSRPPLAAWTQQQGSTLYVPRLEWGVPGDGGPRERAGGGEAAEVVKSSSSSSSGISGGSGSSGSSGRLEEEASRYETTAKLFFLPHAAVAERVKYAEEALALVFGELGVDSIDLLVVSFPGMSFDGDCEWEADKANATQGNDDEEAATWTAAVAPLLRDGRVRRLGVSEFGSEKLERFLSRIADSGALPAVDQINIRNCCNVPPPLVALAKARKIDLLVHTDCTDILPPGTLRELLGQGPQGAGVLADHCSSGCVSNTADGAETATATATAAPAPAPAGADITAPPTPASDALSGDLTPQWVVKYTAVVRDRGVIENKGYFAGAELQDAS